MATTQELADERRRKENLWLNSATSQREFNAMRAQIPKAVSRPDLPRDQMTAADYCRARKGDRDVLGRRIK